MADPEDEEGAGVLQQGYRGEGLQELEAQRPGSRLLLMLTAVLINEMVLDMYLCKFALTSIKSDDFQLCCVI